MSSKLGRHKGREQSRWVARRCVSCPRMIRQLRRSQLGPMDYCAFCLPEIEAAIKDAKTPGWHERHGLTPIKGLRPRGDNRKITVVEPLDRLVRISTPQRRRSRGIA